MSHNHRVAGVKTSDSNLTEIQESSIRRNIDAALHDVYHSRVPAIRSIDVTKYGGKVDAIQRFVEKVCDGVSRTYGRNVHVVPKMIGHSLQLRFDLSYRIQVGDLIGVSMNDDIEETLWVLSVLMNRDISVLRTFSHASIHRLVAEMRRAVLPTLERMESVALRSGKPLPDIAPEEWSKRQNRRGESPANFIRRVYSDWIGHGLTREDILRLDKPLYMAMAKAVERNGPDADIVLPGRDDLADQRMSSVDIENPVDAFRMLSRGERTDHEALKGAKRLYSAARRAVQRTKRKSLSELKR